MGFLAIFEILGLSTGQNEQNFLCEVIGAQRQKNFLPNEFGRLRQAFRGKEHGLKLHGSLARGVENAA